MHQRMYLDGHIYGQQRLYRIEYVYRDIIMASIEIFITAINGIFMKRKEDYLELNMRMHGYY